MTARPAGRTDWPPELPPPQAPEWTRRAVGWLLDQCPGEYRGHPQLRRQPVLLGWLAARHAAAAAQSAREALASVRAELADRLTPAQLEAAVAVCEAERDRCERSRRQVAAVAAALDRAGR